jgi:NADPH:quinone reductase-like Zn-dependent oxidoreductase
MRAVRFDRYGEIDVLDVVEVDDPVPGPGEVLVRVKAAGINPGEASVRRGVFHERWPATFPSGQGSDLAGVIESSAPGWEVGDEVIGWTEDRASQAELVVVPVEHLTRRPPEVPWEVAGSLHVVGATAWAAVRAVSLSPGDTVVVSAAAGGVGSLAVQLAVLGGATVIGLASASHHAWLASHGVVPMAYGDGVEGRIRSHGTVDAFIDAFGSGYVELALDLGVKPERINTIIDFPAVAKYGVKSEGNAVGASASVMGELAGLIAEGKLELPIARTYPLSEVREAYRELERRHTLGKIVLIP